jgi:O-acetyl-ADP-ribose deacetylase (regulator of RNase III)
LSQQSVQILVIQGSILEVEAQAIVNAANSSGAMGGGVAGVIRRAAGPEVEKDAMQQAPIPVGQAVVTSSGKTRFQGIIHAPTMPKPAMRISVDNVGKATRAALTIADEQGFSSLAIPGMGTGVGGVMPADAAACMIKAIKSFVPQSLTRVILVDVDPTMVQAWREQL